MLLEFTVGNFLSFKEKKTFSLEASSITEYKNNIVQKGKYKILRSAVIYGANSSGKSNFIKALEFMVETVRNSSKLNSTDKLNAKPFLLNDKTVNLPSHFEILFTKYGKRYRYGFELDNERIHEEWLYILNENSKKETLYFIRNIDGIGVADVFEEAKIFIENTKENSLFISLLDQLNIEIGKQIMGSFSYIFIQSGVEHEKSITMTSLMHQTNSYQETVEKLINRLNLGFRSFRLESDSNETFKKRINTIHSIFDDNGKIVGEREFKLVEHESSGTNKVFDISGHIAFTLSLGLHLFIDELDAKLHPILTQEIIKLFNNPETNPNDAQLVFTTHDTNLLGAGLFRRDQIWFTEKDNCEATDLYSLLEFKDEEGHTIRKDRSFEKDYINGRYGAIPYISNFQEL
ncbi:abortive phage infection protein [Flavobacterium sp. Leaf82]|uniref:AAA family ATPase n=1 Tax=unclassified Flavobacterium TaxID=196869 RepID=UPI0006FD9E94|nr:ATP-binding protein [Flavobacterium sp. Leaf82]KQO22568.1 abortive phage infection protein [Flavobacterium sp. Leaf82]